MTIWSAVTGLFDPLAKVVDSLHTSDEERLIIKAQINKTQSALTEQLISYEMVKLESQAKVIAAEAQGQSFLQRCWRPITMLTFLGLVVCDSFGLLEFRLSQEAWDLLKIGLGGYVVGRSAEKIAPSVTEVLNSKNK